MGCDIHLFVEKRENGVWVPVDNWKPSEDYPGSLDVDYEEGFYHGRCYTLFSVLADVRNESGKYRIKPICEPKGLPDDVTEPVKACWDCDGHSHSWHTLADLLAYDWTQTLHDEGWLSAVEFYDWNRWDRQRGEVPGGWCESVGGGGTKHISEEAMKMAIQAVQECHPEKNYIKAQVAEALPLTYCHCEWSVTLYKMCQGFLGGAIWKLLRVGKPEDVRIVFWFDN